MFNHNYFIIEFIFQKLDGLPILPELFLLSATLVLLIYGIFLKKDVYNYSLVLF